MNLNLVYCLCAGLLLLSCTGNPSATKQASVSGLALEDTKGNRVELAKPADRVVCLFDPIVDVMYMLGAEEKLFGIPIETYTDKELFQPYSQIDPRIAKKQLATPGSNEMVHVEEIIALKPDLVVVQNMNEGMVNTLQKMDIAVYRASSQSQAQLFKELSDIAMLTGTVERGEALRSYAESKFKEMESKAVKKPVEQRKTVYFTWANGRVFSTTGKVSMMNDCLQYAAVENVCQSAVDQPNINAETLVNWNPDMIIMWNDSPEVFYSKQELNGITALKNRAIYNLMPMFFYNPHTLKSLCASKAIAGWAYGDTAQAQAEIDDVIRELYGKTKAEKLLAIKN